MNIKLKLFFYLILISVSSLSFADDTDGDGIDDSIDNCVSVSNADQVDTDLDDIGNACDADDDGDNVIDSQDAFPLDQRYSKDTDGDSLPDKYELKYGLNYLDGSDAGLDIDRDGLTALEEFGYGTDHRLKDTDRDTLPDNWELLNDRDPRRSDYWSTSSCFTGDGTVLCYKFGGYGELSAVHEDRPDGLIFEKATRSCGLAEGKVYCNGNVGWKIVDIQESVIDLDWNRSESSTCVLTDAKKKLCFRFLSSSSDPDSATFSDQDGDGILDNDDVCPQLASNNQGDLDGDGLGDECDADADDDGVIESPNIRSMVDVNFLSDLSDSSEVTLSLRSSCSLNDGVVSCAAVSGYPEPVVPELINPVHIVYTGSGICGVHEKGLTCWGDRVPAFNYPKIFTNMGDEAQTAGDLSSTCLAQQDVNCWGSDTDGDLKQLYGANRFDWTAPRLFTSGWGRYESSGGRWIRDYPTRCGADGPDINCWSGNQFSPNTEMYTAPSGSEIIDLEFGYQFGCVLLSAGSDSPNMVDCFSENRSETLCDRFVYCVTEDEIVANPIAIAMVGQRFNFCSMSEAKIACHTNGVLDSRLPEQLFNAKKLSVVWHDYETRVCVLEQRGVLCWGNNDHGQSNTATLLNPRDIFAARDYTCAIHDLGVKCWGKYNFEHQSSDIRGSIGTGGTIQDLEGYGFIRICVNDGGTLLCLGQQTGDVEKLEPFSFYSFDPDGDGFHAWEDGLPLNGFENADFEGDGIGDNADTDDDNDGIPDDEDSMPFDTDNDGLNNNVDDDDDNDGILDINDGGPLDTDNDTLNNDIDTDDDNDGYPDDVDEMPLDFFEHLDTDGDGIGNNADTDDDGDGLGDDYDAFPLDASEQVDTDADGVGDNADNCPNVSNADQLNSDDDSLGNACDTDDDNDGVADTSDAFPLDPEETLDTDSDGIGNNTDTDDDGDGVSDILDVFPLDSSETVDTDFDGIGNNADTDDDGDNVPDSSDAFPLNASEWADTDLDGIGNNADTDDDGDGVADDSDAFPLDVAESVDTDSDGIGNNADTDDDGDTYADNVDVFPLDSAEWLDTDSDGTGNNADTDDDNDGVLDGSDAFPLDASESIDTDSDGVGNNADTDDDGDSVLDVNDAFPLDSTESVDTDSDGIGNNTDLDDDNDGVSDTLDDFPLDGTEWVDTDVDGIGNNEDADDDNDGIPDTQEIEDGTDPLDADSLDTDRDGVIDSLDLFPLDSTEWSDSDSDGIGNNADTDDDNDGVSDSSDAFPLDSTETVDTDSDGIGNNADTDDDGDGVDDLVDVYPLNSLYSKDSDLDGMPDAWEIRYGLDPNDPSDATSDQDNDGVTALDEFLAGTIPSGSLDIDGNEKYDALTDGLLLLRGMFGLDGSALITGTVASDATYTESVDIESRIATLGDLADIDGNGTVDALTDGLLTLRYLFGLQGDTLINGVVAGDATRKTAEEIEAHLETLMPAL